jgi:hypothetical protein
MKKLWGTKFEETLATIQFRISLSFDLPYKIVKVTLGLHKTIFLKLMFMSVKYCRWRVRGKAEENCIIGSLIICTLYHILLG